MAKDGAEGGGGAAHTLAQSQLVARWLMEGCSSAELHHRASETWECPITTPFGWWPLPVPIGEGLGRSASRDDCPAAGQARHGVS